MSPPTVQTLQRISVETGYRPDTLEKVLRLLDLLDEIAEDPILSERLVSKEGRRSMSFTSISTGSQWTSI